jgi:hypothetical protein
MYLSADRRKDPDKEHGMPFSPISSVIACVLLAGVVAPVNAAAPSAGSTKAAPKQGPCEQIVQACKNAGFVLGDVKEGNGLIVDCIRPIMNGAAQPTKAKLALPQVSSNMVAECKTKRPNFGEPKPK